MKFIVKFNTALFTIFALLLAGCATSMPQTVELSVPQQAFIERMVTKHQFEREELVQLFATVRHQPKIIQLMTTPHEAKPWYAYRPLFVTSSRAAAGVKFWQQHEALLAQVEAEYGVPANIIVAILGVETNYGPMQGKFKVMDSLSTLAFDYPPRAAFFSSELEQFLLLARDAKFNPATVYGSYAGAIGQPQFMPSSYRRYAVVYQHAGYSDLLNNEADVIASVANYFKKNGWRTGEVIAVRAQVHGQYYQSLKGQDLKPRVTLASLQQVGIMSQVSLASNSRAAFLKLPLQQGYEYWLGLTNFYVLSRYNPRLNYAMAVFQLSQEIVALRQPH